MAKIDTLFMTKTVACVARRFKQSERVEKAAITCDQASLLFFFSRREGTPDTIT